jgi:nucleotide-binding universal stress UspA family protein
MAWRHVACCLDIDGRAERVLAVARTVAAESGARLTLVHGAPRPVLESPTDGGWTASPDDPSRTAAAWLRELAGDAGAEAAVVTGTTPSVVCEWAERERPDLLVVGASRGALQRATKGGFAAHLAYHAPCHVLVVRPTPREEER